MQRIDNYLVNKQKESKLKTKLHNLKTRSSIYNLCLLNVDLVFYLIQQMHNTKDALYPSIIAAGIRQSKLFHWLQKCSFRNDTFLMLNLSVITLSQNQQWITQPYGRKYLPYSSFWFCHMSTQPSSLPHFYVHWMIISHDILSAKINTTYFWILMS